MSGTDRDRIEAYHKRLFGYAMTLTGDRHEAEDLVHDCVVKALSARNRPTDEAAYRAWIFRILKNAFLDAYRKNRTRDKHISEEISEPPQGIWETSDSFINVLTVRQEMARLPEPQREIIALIDISGLSYQECAQFLGVPKGTVMSRISRARAALLDAMSRGNVRVMPKMNKTRKL